MSIKLALLKSGEEVISDIKEIRDSEDDLVSYFFKNPYTIKVSTSQVLIEENENPRHEIIYYKWMSLSKDENIIVNKDWIVCIADPIDSIKKSYEEKMNGRGNVIADGSTSGGTGGDGRDIGTDSSSYNLNEQISFSK